MTTVETRRTHHQVTFAVLAAAVAAYALLQSLVTPVLSTLEVELDTTQATVTWVLTAYLLSASIFTPIMGRVGDKIGKKRVFVATLAALAVGSLLAAVAPNVQVMIVARVIQGIGGGVLPLAFGIIRDEFPAAKLNGAIGAIASLSAVGAGLGIVLAGPIVDLLDYHWLFWLPMILTVLAAVAAYFVVPESRVRTAGTISWLPAVLLSAWLVALLLALSQAPTWGWGSGKVVGLLVASVVLAAVWIQVDVALGLALPAGVAGRVEHRLQPVSRIAILPLFAFSASLIRLGDVNTEVLGPVFLGVAIALPAGKLIGVVAGGAIAGAFVGRGTPERLRFGELLAVALVSGVGFTVSLLMAQLAFGEQGFGVSATLGVLVGSGAAIVLSVGLVPLLAARTRRSAG